MNDQRRNGNRLRPISATRLVPATVAPPLQRHPDPSGWSFRIRSSHAVRGHATTRAAHGMVPFIGDQGHWNERALRHERSAGGPPHPARSGGFLWPRMTMATARGKA